MQQFSSAEANHSVKICVCDSAHRHTAHRRASGGQRRKAASHSVTKHLPATIFVIAPFPNALVIQYSDYLFVIEFLNNSSTTVVSQHKHNLTNTSHGVGVHVRAHALTCVGEVRVYGKMLQVVAGG